jgi:hypothetical protein
MGDERGRSGFGRILAALWGLSLLYVLLHAIPSGAPAATVVVRSDPANATVFGEQGEIGVAPVTLLLGEGERQRLRLVRKDCRDAEVTVEADAFIPRDGLARLKWMMHPVPGEITVRLSSTADASLAVTADPAGTEVFLDGTRLGVAPLSAGGLAPGPHHVRFAQPDCIPLSEDVVLEAGKETRLHRALEDKVVLYYQQVIRKEPGVLTHYAELAHHYVVKGQFKEAGDALRAGLEAAKLPGARELPRFWPEIEHIYTRYFIYPKDTPENKIRPALRAIVQSALDRGIGRREELEGCLKRMEQYDARNPGD